MTNKRPNGMHMAKSFSKTLLIFSLTLSLATSVRADTIHLKSGEKIEADVVGDVGDSIVIEAKDGKDRMLTKDEIEKIDKGPRVRPKPVPAKSAEGQKPKGLLGTLKDKFMQPKSRKTETAQYIVYVPAGLEEGKKYPLIVALHPGADARSMISVWKGLSDRHKWIVFASKEFQNNVDMDKILSSLSTIISADIVKNFPVDHSKIIATGFSGGARRSSAPA